MILHWDWVEAEMSKHVVKDLAEACHTWSGTRPCLKIDVKLALTAVGLQ
jgi:hypothetical protein